MRRWKRIKGGKPFQVGDILILHQRDDNTETPEMMRTRDGCVIYSNTAFMVEIDENGNVIRTYEKGDKLNEGTLVGEANMNKVAAMERLNSLEAASKELEAEIRELRAIIEKADKLLKFDTTKMYGAKKGRDTYALVCIDKVCAFVSLRGVYSRWADCTSGQGAIDNMIKTGGEVFEFDSKKSRLDFMLEENK